MALKNNPAVSKYFIALVPLESIQNEILKLKEEIKERYNSQASFNSPGHITLMMPFEFKESKKPNLIYLLDSFVEKQLPFEVKQDGFGSFEPRVIFLNVSADDVLLTMQKKLGFQLKELRIFEKNYKNQAYRPHMTIAFRDLRKPQFYEARAEFENRDFNMTWPAKGLFLLKHDGKRWQIDQEFIFKG